MGITNFEGWIRPKLPKLQPLYDLAPYPVKNILTTARGYVLTRMRYGESFWRCVKELLEREKESPEAIEEYRNERLRTVVSHAYHHVPFYRHCFDSRHLVPGDIRTVQDLPLLPILTRETVKSHWDELISDEAGRGTVRVFTSGTTGAGLPVVYDRDAYAENSAFRARQKAWAGIRPRDWRISLFGSKIAPPSRSHPPFWVYNYLERQILMSIFHLSPAHQKDYVQFLLSHSGLLVEGFPTVLSILSDFVIGQADTIPMKAVFCDGEPVTPGIRKKMSSAFSCRVFDCYGMTEWAGLIQECEKGGYHLITDYCILEILNENHEPVPAGEEGYLVWTGFTNSAMPFIRYRIGDKGMWEKNQKCECGRPFPLVHPTITRDSDYLLGPDGTIYSPRALNQLLKDKTSFVACQFIQHDRHSIEISVVPVSKMAEREAEQVKRGLKRMLGQAAEVKLSFADKPFQRENGKIPLILSRLRPDPVVNAPSVKQYLA